ncbi:3-oxoacyl-ACP synthase III family protein [Cesiribacter andamanensis]|uniref:3-oxoacyl-[acyl-carrier-protein] synthase 3 n=1 Tax=Cesiribacter andamanensis AMV16 TaxID=1279009 RepID=M7MYL2_9BACT|nr:ketoacyl-ACP synthase III [Cesiribacter andamanensis]EMR01543.1 3-oxoacyl-[acyl-carrier-protein] synthase 3 [Cesiribacter andamanensis AMV16]
MYLNAIGAYLPEAIVDNQYFEELNELSDEWIVSRTGIRQRRKAGPGENTQTMGIAAVQEALDRLPYPLDEIDLIVGATYTPHDTIVTLGHAIQHAIQVHDIPVVTISAACSSLVNAVEIVQGYFALGKASKALVVASEHNTAYNIETDPKSGHLWGDGACALFISREPQAEGDIRIVDVLTGGAATRGKATESVTLKMQERGIIMPNGRDVFIHACQYMPKATLDLLERNRLTVADVQYVIPHQANLRITNNVAETLQLPAEKAVSNVEYLGNTGCAGCGIGLWEKKGDLQKGQKVVLTVFGGGYSYGAMLLQV